MTPELHDQISSGLAKIMMAAKMSNAKLTKSQQNLYYKTKQNRFKNLRIDISQK